VAWFFNSLDKVQTEAEKTALPTHNHPEGIKGAVATATAIFLARKKGKKEMLKTMKLYYSEWEEPVLGANPFYETCQGTMPVVFGIIEKAESFEEAIRYAIAVGGDSDTIGAITGSIAEAIWGIPENIREKVMGYLPDEMKLIIDDFYDKIAQ
jgi:ADP-ribosylglycohydrolase